MIENISTRGELAPEPEQQQYEDRPQDAFELDPWLMSDDQAFVEFAAEIEQELRENSDKKRWSQGRSKCLRLLLANLFIAYNREPEKPVKYYRTPKAYNGSSRYRPEYLKAKQLAPLVDELEALRLVWRKDGYKDLKSERSAMSLVRATEKLANKFGEFELYAHLFFRRNDRPLVILKSKKFGKMNRRVMVEYPEDHESIAAMVSFLNSYNAFLDSTIISCPSVPVDVLRVSGRRTINHTEDEDDEHLEGLFPSLRSKVLYRVFNNVDPNCLNLDNGGRFYGPWWQNIKSEYRPYIEINREPTIELDYSAFHPGMIYHLHGLPFESDLYRVPAVYEAAGDFDEAVLRDTIKKLTNILINATRRQIAHALRMPSEALTKWDIKLPDHVAVKDVLQMIEEHHAPIADWFNTGKGRQLQNFDSEITARILADGLSTGVPVLPIHDSYIVRQRDEEVLRIWMTKHYREIVGPFDPAIKSKGRPAMPPWVNREPVRELPLLIDDLFEMALPTKGVERRKEIYN